MKQQLFICCILIIFFSIPFSILRFLISILPFYSIRCYCVSPSSFYYFVISAIFFFFLNIIQYVHNRTYFVVKGKKYNNNTHSFRINICCCVQLLINSFIHYVCISCNSNAISLEIYDNHSRNSSVFFHFSSTLSVFCHTDIHFNYMQFCGILDLNYRGVLCRKLAVEDVFAGRIAMKFEFYCTRKKIQAFDALA